MGNGASRDGCAVCFERKLVVGGGLGGDGRGGMRGRLGGVLGWGRGGGRGGLGVGDGVVDELVELGAVHDFYEGGALGVGRDHPDGRRVFDADALAERVVGFYFRSEFSLRIGGKGKGNSVVLGVLLRELRQ